MTGPEANFSGTVSRGRPNPSEKWPATITILDEELKKYGWLSTGMRFIIICEWLSVWCYSLNMSWAWGFSDGRGACLCVCMHVCLRARERARVLSFFPPFLVFETFFFFLFKPCCFDTPWALKPLGGRYGLVFEFPAAHREAHKQLARIQCTVSPTSTVYIHRNADPRQQIGRTCMTMLCAFI